MGTLDDAARESDVRNVARQVRALSSVLQDVQVRLVALEEAAVAAREDLVEARDADLALAEALSEMVEGCGCHHG